MPCTRQPPSRDGLAVEALCGTVPEPVTALILALLGCVLQGRPELPDPLDAAEIENRLDASDVESPREAVDVEGRLDSAKIEIRLQDGTVTVQARYRLTPGGEPLDFTTLRFEGQTVSLLSAEGNSPISSEEIANPEEDASPEPTSGAPPLELRTAPGLTRLRGTAGPSGEIRFAYRVTGRLERIPIFVPPWPTVSADERVEIRVLGLKQGGESFPELVDRHDGSFQAQLSNVPSFVRLPATGRSLPLNRAFDALVIAVALLGAGFWLRQRLGSGARSTV